MPQTSELLVMILVALLLAGGGFVVGKKWEEGQQALATQKAEVKQDIQHGKDIVTTEKEGAAVAADTSKPLDQPAPVLSLCPSPNREVRAPAPARPKTDAAPAVRGPDTEEPTVVHWDSTPVVKAGRDADILVAGLQDYILHVCRPQ